jgi:hypothetical protein
MFVTDQPSRDGCSLDQGKKRPSDLHPGTAAHLQDGRLPAAPGGLSRSIEGRFAATWALWNVLQESMEWACLFLHAMQKVLRVSI